MKHIQTLPLLILLQTITLTISALPSFAETGPLGFGEADFQKEMQTDRPDFTEGAQTVEPGHIQFELGYYFVDDSDTDLEAHEVPQSLVRIGLLDDLELRLTWAGYINRDEAGSSDSGVGDMGVGVKQRLVDDLSGFTLSYILELALPTGSSEFTDDTVVPIGKFLWETDLDEKHSLSGNINLTIPEDDNDDRFVEPAFSISLGRSLTDELGVYMEYFGLYPAGRSPNNDDTHFLNGGFTYLLTSDLQFDILAGFGINDDAEDFFSGCGVTFRL